MKWAIILLSLVAVVVASPLRTKRQLRIDRTDSEPALAFGRGRNAVRIGLTEVGSLADTILNAGAQALGVNVNQGNTIDLGRRIAQEVVTASDTRGGRAGGGARGRGNLAFTAQDIEDISTGFSSVLSTFFRPQGTSTSGSGTTGTRGQARGFDADAAVSSLNNFGDTFVDIFRRRSNGGVPQNSADDLVNSFSNGLGNVVNALSGQAPARSSRARASVAGSGQSTDQLNSAIDSLRQSVNGIINAESTGRVNNQLSSSIGQFTNSLTNLLTNRQASRGTASTAGATAARSSARASASDQIETVSNSVADGINSILSVFTSPRSSRRNG